MADHNDKISDSFNAALIRSNEIKADLEINPEKYRMLTGDRPTGNLHIGHLFGSLQNRVNLQNKGLTVFVVIADYQVLTDHDTTEMIAPSVFEIVLDYLAAGLDPENHKTYIFPHSHVPELNQLLLPFLNLVTNSELDRNPTVKEEIQAARKKVINAGMYTYPIHQAADILFCKGNVVPVGKDQLPHLEITRKIARRFNERFAGNNPVFPVPDALLSNAPLIMGLDGSQKMSKSRNNAIMLSATEDETAKAIKHARTDQDRNITYDPVNRPEVSNLLTLAGLALERDPADIAAEIGDGGSSKLKAVVTDALNSCLTPFRKKRGELEQNRDYLKSVLKRGVTEARSVAELTLEQVRIAMNMKYF